MMPRAPACSMKDAGNMRVLKRAKCSVASFVTLAMFGVSVPAAAAEPSSAAGLIELRSNPCLLGKFGHGQPCEVPSLPDVGDARQLAAAHISRSRYFIETHELPQALSEADAALGLNPADVENRHLVARLALSVGDYARAEREIVAAMQQSPQDADLRATNAARLQIQSAPDEALREFNAIIREHPDHAFAHEARAKLLLSLGWAKEAIADLNLLLPADHPRSDLLTLRATAYLATNEPLRAVADYTAAMNDHPQRFDLMTGRATAYELAGDDDAALRDFNTILGPLDGKPNYAIGGDQLAKYRTERAFLLVRLKRFADAATEMMNALNAGGRPAVLRAQVFLRQNGFPRTPLDGGDSQALRTALQACFGLNSCFQRISDAL
jgi:Tfp pilus assembly protein PilF